MGPKPLRQGLCSRGPAQQAGSCCVVALAGPAGPAFYPLSEMFILVKTLYVLRHYAIVPCRKEKLCDPRRMASRGSRSPPTAERCTAVALCD